MGRYAFAALVVSIFSAGAGTELARLFRARGIGVLPAFGAMAGALPPLITWLVLITPNLRGPGFVFALGAALTALLFLGPLAFSRGQKIADILPLASAYGFCLVYPGLLAAFIVVAASGMPRGGEAVLGLLIIVFANDSLAWLVGVTIGGRRGLVEISPNKSLSGFIGGLAGSIIGAIALRSLFQGASHAHPLALALFGLIMGIAVIIGDLFESGLKRSAGVKDSGTRIPGRGGFLDSVDSLLFAAPVFCAGSLILKLWQ
jgi:phosphatidate cytidylyltransferase